MIYVLELGMQLGVVGLEDSQRIELDFVFFPLLLEPWSAENQVTGVRVQLPLQRNSQLEGLHHQVDDCKDEKNLVFPEHFQVQKDNVEHQEAEVVGLVFDLQNLCKNVVEIEHGHATQLELQERQELLLHDYEVLFLVGVLTRLKEVLQKGRVYFVVLGLEKKRGESQELKMAFGQLEVTQIHINHIHGSKHRLIAQLEFRSQPNQPIDQVLPHVQRYFGLLGNLEVVRLELRHLSLLQVGNYILEIGGTNLEVAERLYFLPDFVLEKELLDHIGVVFERLEMSHKEDLLLVLLRLVVQDSLGPEVARVFLHQKVVDFVYEAMQLQVLRLLYGLLFSVDFNFETLVGAVRGPLFGPGLARGEGVESLSHHHALVSMKRVRELVFFVGFFGGYFSRLSFQRLISGDRV